MSTYFESVDLYILRADIREAFACCSVVRQIRFVEQSVYIAYGYGRIEEKVVEVFSEMQQDVVEVDELQFLGKPARHGVITFVHNASCCQRFHLVELLSLDGAPVVLKDGIVRTRYF